jgi:hypothetical protein
LDVLALLHAAEAHDEVPHGEVSTFDVHEHKELFGDRLALKIDVRQGVCEAETHLEIGPLDVEF